MMLDKNGTRIVTQFVDTRQITLDHLNQRTEVPVKMQKPQIWFKKIGNLVIRRAIRIFIKQSESRVEVRCSLL